MGATLKQSPDNQSLAERAYHLLEGQLVSLNPPPGELVSERELMVKAGIGRTPVREAIQRLSAEGLLQVLPRKGLMVTPIRRSDLNAIIETRRVLERLMVVKSAERATGDQRQAFLAVGNHIETTGNDFEMLLRQGYRLEALLEAACHNRFLVKALTAMRSQCWRLWYLNRRNLDLAYWAQLQGGLARAVAGRDGAGAIRANDEIIATLESLVNRLDVMS